MLILYQPIVDVRSREIVKAEALCRLGTPTNPQKPADFIPYAEQNGFWLKHSQRGGGSVARPRRDSR